MAFNLMRQVQTESSTKVIKSVNQGFNKQEENFKQLHEKIK